MTRAALGTKKPSKRPSAIPRFGNKIQKTKTLPISAVAQSTLQGRCYSKKTHVKSVRFAGVKDVSLKTSSKAKDETASLPTSNNHIGEDFVFETDPDALASILNNDGVTREQLIKSQAAEAAKTEKSADEYLLVDGRPSLCRRVPIKRAPGVLPDGRPSLLSVRVSAGPARVERPSVSGRTSFMKKGSAAPSFGRDSLFSFIEQKYSQKLKQPDLELRRTTIATAGNRNPNHGLKLTDRTNKVEIREPQRVMSTKKVAPTTPAARVLVAANPVLGSPALRVRQSVKKTPMKSRLALSGSPAMKDNVVATLDFQDEENVSPKSQVKLKQVKKNTKPIVSQSRLLPPSQISKSGVSGIKPVDGAATKSKLPPRNSDRYSFIRKPVKVAKDSKLHTRFAPISLKHGEELVRPKTLNEAKPIACKSNSKPERTVLVKVCSPTVLNGEDAKLKHNESAKFNVSDKLAKIQKHDSVKNFKPKFKNADSAKIDVNDNDIDQSPSKVAETNITSPKGVVTSRIPVRKVMLDADAVLDMMKRKLKTIKRRSVQSEFCFVMKSMEMEMSLASVAEKPELDDTHDKVGVSTRPSTEENHVSETAPPAQEKSWRDVLKRDKSPSWKAVLEKESKLVGTSNNQSSIHEKSDDNVTSKTGLNDGKSLTWKDVFKHEASSENVATNLSKLSSQERKESIPTGGTENLRRLLSTDLKRDPFKGQDYDKGNGLGITKGRFLNILGYNPTPRSNPVVTAREKIVEPIRTDGTKGLNDSASQPQVKNDDCPFFTKLKAHGGKFFPVARASLHETYPSDKPPTEEGKLVSADPQDMTSSKISGASKTSSACSQAVNNAGREAQTASQSASHIEESAWTSTNAHETAEISVPPSEKEREYTHHFSKVTQQIENEKNSVVLSGQEFKTSPLGSNVGVKSAQWVEKTPNLSRFDTNRARIVYNHVESPKSPKFDAAKSLFWVKKTPASHRSKMAEKDLVCLAGNSSQEASQNEYTSVEYGEEPSGVSYTKNRTTTDSEIEFDCRDDSLTKHGGEFHMPTGQSPNLQISEPKFTVGLCSEVEKSPPPVANSVNLTETNLVNSRSCHDDDRLKIFDGASWCGNYGSSKHKISSGRLGKETTTKKEAESTDSHENIPILKVFSPKLKSPRTVSTSPASTANLHYNTHRRIQNDGAIQEFRPLKNTYPSSPVSPTMMNHGTTVSCLSNRNDALESGSATCLINEASRSAIQRHSPELKKNVRFSDVVTQIDSLEPTKADGGLSTLAAMTYEGLDGKMTGVPSTPSSLTNTPSSSSLGCFRPQQLQDKSEHSSKKSPLRDMEPVSDFNAVDLDLSFLDSLHVVAIETKNDVTTKRSPSSKRDDSSSLSQNPLPSKSPQDHRLQNSPSSADADVLSTPSSTHEGYLTAQRNSKAHVIQNNLAPPISQTLPALYEPQLLPVPASMMDESFLADVKESVTMEDKVIIPGVSVTNSKPPLLSILDNARRASPPLQEVPRYQPAIHPASSTHGIGTNNDQDASAAAQKVPSKLPSIHPTATTERSNTAKDQAVSPDASKSPGCPPFVPFTRSICDGNMKNSQVVSSVDYTLPSACEGGTVALTEILQPTPLKLFNGSRSEMDSITNSNPKLIVSVVAPKPIFPPPPQTPAAFRQLRRKLQESPVPKTFRSRCSPLKSSAFGGVRKTPQRRVRFASSSPYMKSLCSKRFTEALLDEEVALLTCRRYRSPGTPSKKTRSRITENPIGRVLLIGDDSHFVPISPIGVKKKSSVAVGSAFSAFKP